MTANNFHSNPRRRAGCEHGDRQERAQRSPYGPARPEQSRTAHRPGSGSLPGLNDCLCWSVRRCLHPRWAL